MVKSSKAYILWDCLLKMKGTKSYMAWSLVLWLSISFYTMNVRCFFVSRSHRKDVNFAREIPMYRRYYHRSNLFPSSKTDREQPEIDSKQNRYKEFMENSFKTYREQPQIDTKQHKYRELMDNSKLQLAPMMEYTDRHFRHVVRLISNKTLLYTEMVAANALAHERNAVLEEYFTSNPETSPSQARENYSDHYLRRYLSQGQIAPLEGPSVLQLGGSDPNQMFEAAQTVMDMTERGWCDYTALNLNCGCPSPKVAGKGCFGAALMDSPQLVAELTTALHEGTGERLPVTVKCRIGTDTHEPFTSEGYAKLDPEIEYSRLCQFIEEVASNGIVTDFSIHARIAVLQKSFSPADNRKIPPLKYDLVQRLIQDYPQFTFTLNGGIDNLSQAQKQLSDIRGLNGIMIGRGWAADPWSFAMADKIIYDTETLPKNRLQLLTEYGRHADAEEALSDPVKIRRFIVKAVTTLFTAEPNAKRYRIALDEIAALPKKLQAQGKSLDGQPPVSELILSAALTSLSEEVLLRTPEESYERKLYEETKATRRVHGDIKVRSSAITDWQINRESEQKENGMGEYETALAGTVSSMIDHASTC